MTNNEAAKWIQLYIDLAKIDPNTGEEAYLNDDDKKTIEAMEMAINALTAQESCNQLATNLQPCKQDDLISRSMAIDALTHEWDGMVTSVFDVVKSLPSAQPETHEKRTETHECDLISRQAAIEWCLEGLNNMPSAEPDLDEVYAHAETEAEARFHAEIVRCKDCKHQVKEWRTDKRLKNNGYWVYGCDVIGEICGYWALFGQDDDFCCFAERKENR